MMFSLIIDVMAYSFNLRRTIGETSVARLPCKFIGRNLVRFNKFTCTYLYISDQIRYQIGYLVIDQDMYVVGGSAYRNCLMASSIYAMTYI